MDLILMGKVHVSTFSILTLFRQPGLMCISDADYRQVTVDPSSTYLWGGLGYPAKGNPGLDRPMSTEGGGK